VHAACTDEKYIRSYIYDRLAAQQYWSDSRPTCGISSFSPTSLVCLSTGALRCVVYRECTTRLLTAVCVTPAEQHSHRCPVTTSTRASFCQKHLLTSHVYTRKFRIPEYMTCSAHSQRPDHQHQGSFPSDPQLPLDLFEKMDKVRVTILLAVFNPRHRCAASFHPSGKRMHFLQWHAHAHPMQHCMGPPCSHPCPPPHSSRQSILWQTP
jgi:hypothetical protein